MPRHFRAIAAAAPLFVAAVAWAAAPEIPAGAQPLNEAEIKALLDGKTFSFEAYDQPLIGTSTWNAAAGTVSGDYVWQETDKGTYEAKWFVEDGKNCTQSPDQDAACQTLYRYGDGFMEVTADGVVHAVSMPSP